MLLARVLNRLVTSGTLDLVDAHGRTHRIGPPSREPEAVLRLHDPALHRDLLLHPRLRFGKAYMDGRLTVERGTLYDSLDVLSRDGTATTPFGRMQERAAWLARQIHQRNPLPRARRNVAHHFDLSRALYDLFLDRDLQYSRAYFADPAMDLDAAQEAKKRHIAAKLLLRPGLRVPDVGSGWGGLALSRRAPACGAAGDGRVTTGDST